jgi:hypothetical protein
MVKSFSTPLGDTQRKPGRLPSKHKSDFCISLQRSLNCRWVRDVLISKALVDKGLIPRTYYSRESHWDKATRAAEKFLLSF